jgi:hypothetical protein
MVVFGIAGVLFNKYLITHESLSSLFSYFGIKCYYSDILAYEIVAFVISLIILHTIVGYRRKERQFFYIPRLTILGFMALIAYSLSFGLFGYLPDKSFSLNIQNLTFNVAILMFIIILSAALLLNYVHNCINDCGYKYCAESRPVLLIIIPIALLPMFFFQPFDNPVSMASICLMFVINIGLILLAGILFVDHEQLFEFNFPSRQKS